ncbi:MAG: apolipoprotein N-acyltransferase [Opitutaceae bacterium]|nr:apolipoprotein N-acyltransferase [Opitutaceae bacterium]
MPVSPAPDPYEPRPSVWQRHPQLGWTLGVFAATAFLTFAAFPPLNTGEAAYVLALPAALWAYRRPPFRLFAWTVGASQVVAWTALLGWLHHVTWVGLLLLGPFVGGLASLWFLGLGWAIPRIAGQRVPFRILGLLALAALWVLGEWLRAVLFGGFPWLPLAASQWQKPFLLQMAAYGGAWTVSFVLISFNLGAAAYAHRAFFEGATGLRKRSPEFNVALLLLMGSTFPFLGDIFGQQRHRLARVALVQPYIPQEEKWDERRSQAVIQTIEAVTLDANRSGTPDVIVWPEAVIPWPLYRDPQVERWLDTIARRTGKPLLLGTVYTRPSADPEGGWFNGAVVVEPVAGLQAEPYAKRHLVPFGEYVPWRPGLGWISKFAPIGGDFERGDDPRPLGVPVGPERVPVGVLICYEDIFPGLARESAQAGAEMLAVLTNNAWYGEGGAAYQHAAHSVLRAVETRRPVIRCGNGGWSGWIDEFGYTRATLKDEHGSVYFRGAETVTVTRDLRWHGRQSFYVEHGDWFLLVCAGLAFVGYFTVLVLRPPPVREGENAY